MKYVDFDCTDPYRQARFWAAVLGEPQHPDDRPGDDECEVVVAGGGPSLLFQRVPEGKAAKNRLHLDLQPTDRDRDEELDRLLVLGATVVDDRRDAGGWVVLADPEGNEFCLESRTPA
ncbi:glyoxalase [Paractinoplanes rishiriensis]|uniref:Glyoxalase n=2 Tax=Paractinoplanes rishiriensis TaxID=1050105 RepID=A0A919K5X1_9ACTN|nr:glyoxalase [Actinoplanes rishiriensis]